MRKGLFIQDDVRFMTRQQCEDIRDNQYRSKHNDQDYCPFAIEQRLTELDTKRAEKFMSKVDEHEAAYFAEGEIIDSQLLGLVESWNPGKALLMLIDAAYAQFEPVINAEAVFSGYEATWSYNAELNGFTASGVIFFGAQDWTQDQVRDDIIKRARRKLRDDLASRTLEMKCDELDRIYKRRKD